VPTSTLFVCPHVPSYMPGGEMTIPVFTPGFWAWLDYNDISSTGTLAITRVFPGYEGLTISHIASGSSPSAKKIELDPPLKLVEGETIDFAGWPKTDTGRARVQNVGELAVSTETTVTESISIADEGTSGVLTKDQESASTETLQTEFGP